MNRRSKVSKEKAKLSDKGLCHTAKQKSGVIDARVICPSEVETAAWVRLKCQFGCGCYGQCLVCPPFTPSPEQMRRVLDAYCRAILIHFDPETDVKAIVAEQLGVKAEEVKDEAKFIDDLGADSLDTVELVMALEEEFETEIPDEEAEKITTVQLAIDYINNNLD